MVVGMKYLSIAGVARRRNLAYGTVNRYWSQRHVRTLLLPVPDAWLVEEKEGLVYIQVADDQGEPENSRPLWLPETIEGWKRVGSGTRTDLRKQ